MDPPPAEHRSPASPQGGGNEVSRRHGPPHHLPFRHCGLSCRIVLHPPAAGDIKPPQRQGDLAFIAVGAAFDHRPISFADRPGLEQFTELRQGLAVAPEHQAAGRIAVEPVRQSRRARQPEAQRAEIIFQACAAFGTAMYGDAGGLIDDQHQTVAIEQPRHHFFCGDVFRGHGGTAITDRPDNDSTRASASRDRDGRQHGRNNANRGALVAAPR